MPSEEHHEIIVPIEIREAMQIFISFLTANFSYEDGIDEVDFKICLLYTSDAADE